MDTFNKEPPDLSSLIGNLLKYKAAFAQNIL